MRVEADFSADPLEPNGFDFNGAMLSWSLDHGFDEEAKRWWVAVGFFGVSEAVPENKVEALVFENGAALVYGAIRDLVSTITARGVLGPLMLPTPTFVGALGEQRAWRAGRGKGAGEQAADRSSASQGQNRG